MLTIASIRGRTTDDGDCWIWQGAHANFGRNPVLGNREAGDGSMSVRRRVWELHHGKPIPAGKIIVVTCECRRCVNPEHLKLTTMQQLTRELGAKGVMSGSLRSAKIAATHRQRHPNTKLTQEQVRAIRASDETGAALAVRYGVAESTISRYRLHQCRREYTANPFAGLGA